MNTTKLIISIFLLLAMSFASKAFGYNTDLGTLNPGGTITHSASTVGLSNVYGNGSPDYVYRVYISGPTTLEVNTCGCGWDSYLHVLDAADTRLGYDDDACGGGSSRIQGLSIPGAGEYYIMVDGYSSSNSGPFTLNIISTGGSTALNGGAISINSTSVSSGSSPGTFTNVSSASGGTGTYSYQWQQSTDNANWSNISGATNEYYTVPALYASTYYRRAVTSGTVAYSNTVVISVTQSTSTFPEAGIVTSTGSAWGASIPNNSANWNMAYSWGNHAGLYRPISYVPSWSEITSKPTTVSGFGITNAMTTSHAANSITATNINTWNAKQNTITLTTNGTSGAAEYNGTTLNIPQYSAGSWSTNTNNFTSGGLSIGSVSLVPPASGLYVKERVGIHTNNPSASLHIYQGTLLMNGNSYLNEGDARINIDTELSTGHNYILCKDVNGEEFKVDWEGKVNCGGVHINKTPEWNSGNLIVDNLVRIGCTNVSDASVKLAVEGHIKATQITVESSVCSDFVFEEDYKLPTLSEVEKFVKVNKHLPEIPSMHEFKEKGQNLAEMDDLLLRKIEEMTLYLINQNKKIELLENELKKLKND